MKIFAIDTTASPASAAILSDGRLLGEYYLNIKTTHSQTLMPMTESLLKNANIKIDDIDVFAVNAGPGSFTGVRIGVASIKGMTFTSNKPCASVSTLEAMAWGMPYFSGIVCAVMDARCAQVYSALFRLENGSVRRLCDDRAISIQELSDELAQYKDETVYLAGDGAELCFKEFSEQHPNVYLTPENVRFQHAYGTAKAAERLISEGKLCTSDELMPIYLRVPQAERELKARQQNNKN